MKIELITIYVVTEVVSLAVFNELHLIVSLAEIAKDFHSQMYISLLRAAADAIGLTHLAAFCNLH